MCRSHLRTDHWAYSFLCMNPLRTDSRRSSLGMNQEYGNISEWTTCRQSLKLTSMYEFWVVFTFSSSGLSCRRQRLKMLRVPVFRNIPAGHHVSPAWRDIKQQHLCSRMLPGWCLLGTDSRNGILLDPVFWSSWTQLIILDSAWLGTKSTKLSHIIHGKHVLLPFLFLPRIRDDLPSAWNTWTANGENQRVLFNSASAWNAPTWFFTSTCCHFHSSTGFMRVLRFKFSSCNLNLVEWASLLMEMDMKGHVSRALPYLKIEAISGLKGLYLPTFRFADICGGWMIVDVCFWIVQDQRHTRRGYSFHHFSCHLFAYGSQTLEEVTSSKPCWTEKIDLSRPQVSYFSPCSRTCSCSWSMFLDGAGLQQFPKWFVHWRMAIWKLQGIVSAMTKLVPIHTLTGSVCAN